MQLDIPFFSQLDKEIPTELQRSVCSIACIKMIFDFRGVSKSFQDIYKETQIIGGRETSGWNHETLVRILRNHGILAYRQEFFGHVIDLQTMYATHAEHSTVFEQKGFQKIKETIEKGNPVIVSVFAGFSQDVENKKSLNMVNHMVVITGIDNEYVYVNDPIFETSKKFSHTHFMNYWRRLSIFVE
jgi:uncharacterized protein YvpB